MNQSEVRAKLHEGWVQIEFEKVNGETRQMTATLNEADIPKVEADAVVKSPKVRSDEALAVWDVVANGWRSFRWDKLKLVNSEAFVYGAE